MSSETDEDFVKRVARDTGASRRLVARKHANSGANRRRTAEDVYERPCQYGAGPLECSCTQHASWRAENGY